MRGLYTHIPFCVKKCAYCDFYSLPDRLDCIDEYIEAVLREAHKYAGMSFETLYLGGGTPSLLGAQYLKQLATGLNKEFDLSKLNEATIEANPESATREFLQATIECGFNRISIGVQSLNDTELKSVGRIHSAQQAIGAIKLAQATGFKNITCDLIIGLPGQTWQSLKRSISKLIALNIRHLSVYCLSLEPDTPLEHNPPANLPSDDRQVELFEKAVTLLKSPGFVHYEISNFALPGYECRHNLNYWRGGEYLGLGPAAASHLEGIRFKNKPNLDAYLKRPTAQTTEVEQLDIKHKAEEETILRLRLLEEGVNVTELQNKYGKTYTSGILRKLSEMVSSGELVQQSAGYRLHPARIMTSNQVFTQILIHD